MIKYVFFGPYNMMVNVRWHNNSRLDTLNDFHHTIKTEILHI